MASIKIERLQEMIRQKVATVVMRDLADPRLGLITITKVDLARDMSSAKIYWSSLEPGGKRTAIEHALDQARGWVQREVARMLSTRITPQLEFSFDRAIEGVDRVSTLLREARDEDVEAARARGEFDEDQQDGNDDEREDPDEPQDTLD
ncbi:MAG: ribosome-binding factor A [Planctomycetes bacterium]|nr:ribosome-binding factor A [Planctomycetota bacterium]